MKILASPLMFLVFSLATQTSLFAQQAKEENIRLNCLEKSFDENGINLSEKLELVENYLIQTYQLDDRSGNAFYAFFERVKNSEDHYTILPADIINMFLDISPQDYFDKSCMKKFNTTDSTLLVNKLEKKLKEVMTRGSGFQADHIAGKILETLKKDDFEKPYFRTMSLLYIANSSLQETPEMLNMILQKSFLGEPCPFIPLELSANNSWIINNTEIREELLIDYLKKEFSSDPSRFCVTISTSRKSAYSTYIALKDIVYQLYSDERENLAKKLFQKSYKELSLTQRIQIEEKIPIQFKTELVD